MTTMSPVISPTLSIGKDLTIRRLGYGAIHLTGPGYWGPPADPDEAVRLLRRAVDLGVNFIDETMDRWRLRPVRRRGGNVLVMERRVRGRGRKSG